MGINIIDIVKQSVKFTSINFFGKLMMIPKQIIITLILGPAELGIIGYIMLWVMYANWITTGASASLPIEMPALLKTNQIKKALNLQYIAWSADFCIVIIVFIGLMIAAFFQSTALLRNLLIIGSFYYALQKVAAYLHSMNWIRLNFSELAKIQLYITIIPTVLTFLFIYWLKIYALLVVPFITVIINIILLLRIKSVGFEFRYDKKELFRLIRKGIVVTLASIVFAAFVGVVDNTVISKYLSFDQLGIFIFSYTFMSMMSQGLKDFCDVFKPIFYGQLDTESSDIDAFKGVKRMAIYFSIFSCIAMTFSQIGFIVLVEKITIKYSASKIVFMFLSTQIFLETMGILPTLVLQSNRARKQIFVLIAMFLGLSLNIVLDIIVVKLGYGIVGISVVTPATYGFATILLYFFSRNYMTSSTKLFFLFILKLIIPFVFSILLTFMNWSILKYFDFWYFVGFALMVNLIVWLFLILTFYSRYFSISKLKSLKNILMKKA